MPVSRPSEPVENSQMETPVVRMISSVSRLAGGGRVAQGGCPPRAPTDPYVRN
jgi:hypothetical protein